MISYLWIRFTHEYRPPFILTSPLHIRFGFTSRVVKLNVWHLCKSIVTFSYLVTLLGFVPGYLKIILQEQSTTSLTLAALFLFKTDQIQHLRRPPQEAQIGLRPHFPPFEFIVSRGRSDFSFWMCSPRRALLCGPGSFHMISEPDKWDCIIMLWLLRSSG